MTITILIPLWALAAIAGVALLALVGALWASVRRRRARRERLKLEERAAADLERRVEERTADLVAARDELVRVEKSAAIGELLASLGQELGPPISTIRSNADDALKLLAAGRLDAVRDRLRAIAAVTERAGPLTRNLEAFTREGNLPLVPTPLVSVVQSALQLVTHQAREASVSIRIGSGISGCWVQADPVRLEQVLVNLLTNALDAVAGRRERWIALDAAATADTVEITVADSGPGIPAERRDRVFEPTYTTKEPGLGLGLAIAYGIMRDMGGTLAVVDGPAAGGAAFHLTLRAGTAA